MANACGALNGSVLSQPVIYQQRPGPQPVGSLPSRSSLLAPPGLLRGWRDRVIEEAARHNRSLHQRKNNAWRSGTCKACQAVTAAYAAKSGFFLAEAECSAERRSGSIASVSVFSGFGVGTMPWLMGKPRLCRQEARRRSRQPLLLRAAAGSQTSSVTVESSQQNKSRQQEARREQGEVPAEDLDFTTRVLEETPSQVEPRFLVDGKLLTLRERRLQGKKPLGREQVILEEPDLFREQSSVGTVVQGSSETADSQPVFLKDLLREYKGNLYVPEEAFKERLPEVESFSKTLVALPEMTVDDFWHYVKVGQVKCLTSRGIAGPRAQFQYRDFIVDLEDRPGDSSLQQRRWALRADPDQAALILQQYKGKQREVETYHTPYVEVPSKAPHPVAATVSARFTTEVTILASLIVSVAAAIASLTSSTASALFQSLAFVFVRVVRPVVLPLVQPVIWLAVKLALLVWAPIGAVLGAVGSLVGAESAADLLTSLPTFFVDTAGGMAGSNGSSFATGGLILFVLGFMVAMAKFTLTRRPKDFRKWDIWQAIDFGQSKPQARVDPNSVGVKFEDVAGIDEVVTELQELVTYLKDPDRFSRMGTKPPHGVLLEGPPGCGKTLLAKAIAGEAGVPFYQMAGSEFVEILVGVGAARVRDLFKRAKVNRPAVVFIDEIDALGTARDRLMPSDKPGQQSNNTSAQERETTLNQLLIELDGFDTGKGVIFLGATNRSDMLDAALLRPGRFDRKVTIRPPLAQGRLEILQVHSRKLQLDESVDLWTLAKNLPGFTGAMLAQLMQEAGLMSFRRGDTIVKREDVDRALDRLTMGTEREVTAEKTEMHRRMALHELGMGLCAQILYRRGAAIEPLDRVSVAPRGNTLSRTMFDRMDDEDYVFERRPALISRLMVMLAGRAAEELVYGPDTSTYSLTHLPDATWLARKIVSVWNLGEKMVVKGDKVPWQSSQSFAGPVMAFEGTLYEDYAFKDFAYSTEVVDDVSEQSRRLLDDAYARTFTLLKEHRGVLETSLEALLERDELLNSDIDKIIDEVSLPSPPSSMGALMPPSSTWQQSAPSISDSSTDESPSSKPAEAGASQRPPQSDPGTQQEETATTPEAGGAELDGSAVLSLGEEAALLAEIDAMSAEEQHAALGLCEASSEDAPRGRAVDGDGDGWEEGSGGSRVRDSLPPNGGDPGQSGLQSPEGSVGEMGHGRVRADGGGSALTRPDSLVEAEGRGVRAFESRTGGVGDVPDIVIGGDESRARAEDSHAAAGQSWGGTGGDVSGMLGSRNPGALVKRQNGKPGLDRVVVPKTSEPTPVRSGALE